MISKFEDIDRAITYVAQGVASFIGDANVNIVYYPDGRIAASDEIYDSGHLVSPLRQLCRRFPEALVYMEVDNHNVPTGAIQCRYGHRVQTVVNTSRARSHADRPIIILHVCRDGVPPSAEEKAKIRDSIQAKIHEWYETHKSKTLGKIR